MKNNKEQLFDELLIMQHQAGNEKALSLLIKRWHKRMLMQSYRFTRNTEISKDIVQECWITIIKKLGSIKEPSKFGVWSFSIVTHKSIDWVRQEQKKRNDLQQYQPIQNLSAEQKKESDSKEQKIKIEIEKLPLKQQIVLKLFYVENYSIREIGTILNIATGTVKSRLFKAREQLKKCITKK